MAIIQPTFDKTASGSGTMSGASQWFDLSSYGFSDSPMVALKQLMLGYFTFGAPDKNMVFQLFVNNSGQSTGTLATCTLIGEGAAQAGNPAFIDCYQYGSIATLAPLAASTGVEKLWLLVSASSSSAGAWNYYAFYTVLA